MSHCSRFVVAAWLLLAATSVQAQPITSEQLMRHIRVLASDEYEGRAPGTAGGERSEAYVLEAFAGAGLTPGTATGWRQTISLKERRSVSSTVVFRKDGKAYPVAPGSAVLLGREPHMKVDAAPVFFAGYGTAKEVEAIDVRGAVLLLLSGKPSNQPEAPSLAARKVSLAKAGAAAIFVIAAAEDAWSDIAAAQGSSTSLTSDFVNPIEGAITSQAVAGIMGTSGDPNDLTALAASPNFRVLRLAVQATLDVRTSARTFQTANIIGKVEGRSRPTEAVILIAHWDHLGLCRPEGAKDRICNGAVDNASGTAILIEAARALAQGPRPERSIYFVATTAEETGFFGAEAFVDAPPAPIKSIVGVLNIDTTAIAPRGLPVAIIGRGRCAAIDRIIDETSQNLNRQVDIDTEANIMIKLQDGWVFSQRGIPAVMATGSVSNMKNLTGYLSGIYHGPSDDLTQKIELGGAAEDANLQIAIARGLADPIRFAPAGATPVAQAPAPDMGCR